MADNFYDMTGTLRLGKVTPVIKALFGPFELDEEYPGDGAVYIANIAESSRCSWDAVLENLEELAKTFGLSLREDEEQNVEQYFRLLARHFKVETDPEIERLIEDNAFDGFDGDARIDTLFALALRFEDGHGLKTVETEGSWHCSKPHLGGFGGCGEFHGRYVSVISSSQQAARLGDELEAALHANDIDGAARCIMNGLASTLDGIVNSASQQSIKAKLRDLLQTE